ncbi:hypothetical protein Bhyg_04983, partial [Pseudolycoriella hygida]
MIERYIRYTGYTEHIGRHTRPTHADDANYDGEENSDIQQLDYKQFRQSMVNLDSGNSLLLDKNLLHISNNSCEVDSSHHPSATCSILSYRNAKQNLSESCV